NFPDRILFTDEATFTTNGVFNSRNFLYRAEENPHVVRVCGFQYRWTINVWAGVIGNRIVSNKCTHISKLRNCLSYLYSLSFIDFQIGPYFLPPRLTGQRL
ncbi:hypothetical protein X777_08598, partial [Ooceraea biroi]